MNNKIARSHGLDRPSHWMAKAVLVGLMAAPLPVSAITVGVELTLLVDISGSVDITEYNLQLQGYVDALNNPLIHNAIAANPTGSIAVNMVMWSGNTQQSEVIGWRQVSTAAEVQQLATDISTVGRPFSGGTAPQTAISSVLNGVLDDPFANSFEGLRHVIDISTDGVSNLDAGNTNPSHPTTIFSGCLELDNINQCTTFGRDAALALGVDAINVLAIDPAPSSPSFALVQQYANGALVAGTGQVFLANGFTDFGDAILTKLQQEIRPVPEPTTLALLSLGISGLGLHYRRKGRRKTQSYYNDLSVGFSRDIVRHPHSTAGLSP